MRKAACIAVAAAVAMTAAALAAAPPAVRQLVFPPKQIGKLECASRIGFFLSDIGPASGTRVIPSHCLAVLRPNENIVATPSSWSLIPKDIDGLDFRDAELTDDQVANLVKNYPSLKFLWVSESDLTDAFFVKLPTMPALEDLGASHLGITGVGIKQFTKFPNLRYLYLHDTLITDDDCALLAEHPKLENLQLHHTSITDKGVAYLGKLPNLHDLNLSRTRVTAEGLKQLTACRKKLLWLCLYLTDTGDDGLAAVNKFENLQTLIFSGYKKPTCSAKGIAALAPLKRLQLLDLNESDISDDVVAAIPKAVPWLLRLNMNACKKLTDAAFSDYNKMSKVTEFRIAGSPAGDKFMKAAGTWRQLQLLQAGSLVSDTGVKSFCDAKSPVRTLLLENCKVTDKGVSYLSSLPELHALSLSGDNVTDACIPTLIKLKRLEGLALQNTKITPEGYAKLKAAFPAARIRY